LLASSRKPNGSNLKQSSTVADAPNPLDVLEKLLGSERNGKAIVTKGGSNGSSKEDNFEEELDFGGLSLREFVSRESLDTKERYVSPEQSLEECMFNNYQSASFTH